MCVCVCGAREFRVEKRMRKSFRSLVVERITRTN